MNTPNEKAAFGVRLREILANKGWEVNKPTWLASEFNQRYEGNPISVQAANNWLQGLAIPSQDKLRVLSLWLDVSSEYLRYGDQMQSEQNEDEHAQQSAKHFGFSDLPEKIGKLSAKHKKLVYDVVQALLDQENK